MNHRESNDIPLEGVPFNLDDILEMKHLKPGQGERRVRIIRLIPMPEAVRARLEKNHMMTDQERERERVATTTYRVQPEGTDRTRTTILTEQTLRTRYRRVQRGKVQRSLDNMRNITPNSEEAAQALHVRAVQCRQWGVTPTWRDEVQFQVGWDAAIAAMSRMLEAGTLAHFLAEHEPWAEPMSRPTVDVPVFEGTPWEPLPSEERLR